MENTAVVPLVLSHSPCMDGFTAAWAAWLKHPDWEFYPAVYGTEPPDVEGREVFMLDFSYKRPVMEKLVRLAKRITVLDHHVTAKDELAPLLEDGAINGVFDMTHSGAYLSWVYFHDTRVPYFVRLVEDRDLGNPWSKEGSKLPHCTALNMAFFSYDYDFYRWNQLRYDCEDDNLLQDLVNEGTAIQRQHMKDIRELVTKTQHARFIGGSAPIPTANLPYTLCSDAAHLMAENAPFAATYFYDGQGYVFSLRSRDDGADVSEIAKLYGGGGHKHAAGFTVPNLEAL